MNYEGFKAIEPAGFFRGIAREALRGRWGLAFGAGTLYLILTQLPVTIFDNLFGTRIDSSTLASLYGTDASVIEELYGSDFYLNATSGISGLYTILTSGAFSLGMAILVIHILRRADAGPGLLFSGFGNYFKSLGVMVLIMLICLGVIIVAVVLISIISLLGSMVAISLISVVIIGMIICLILVYLMYSLSYYILADNPGMGVISCLRSSRLMMRGNKGKLFVLYLSFIGWALLYLLYALIIGVIISFVDTGLYIDIISALMSALGSGILAIYIFTSEAAFYEKVSGISSGMFNLSGTYPNDDPGQNQDQSYKNNYNDDRDEKPKIGNDRDDPNR